MGKSKKRRINARRRWLKNLSETNPRVFMVEWTKRLESWKSLFLDGTNRLKTQELATMVYAELKNFGPKAVSIAMGETKQRIYELIQNQNTPRHLFKLSNYEALEQNAQFVGARIPGGTYRIEHFSSTCR